MNEFTPLALALALSIIAGIHVQAQAVAASSDEDFAFVARTDLRGQAKSAYRPNSAFLSAQRLSTIYTGYAIELANSNLPIDRYHPIFRQFGNVQYEKLPEGKYTYLITGDFSSDKAALEFLERIIKPRVPGAKLFYYKQGRRKEIGG